MIATRLSPRFIARFSGLPASAAAALSTQDIRDSLRCYLARHTVAQRAGQSASDVIFSLVSAEVDVKRRGAMLRLRRDLFNCRVPRQSDHQIVAAAAPREVAAAISSAVDALTCRAAAQHSLLDCLEKDIISIRQSVGRIAGERNLADGILLSSPHLYRNIDRYVEACGERSLNSRDLQVERGILRYLTRASMKATPFAAFCIITEGEIVAVEQAAVMDSAGVPLISSSGSRTPRRNIVRLNKRIFGTLWNHLKMRPAVRGRLTVDLNPTIRASEGQWRFLAMVKSIEVFQHAGSNPALDLIIEELRTHSGKVLQDLITLVATDPRVEATAEEAAAYLDALLEIGLIRFRSPVGPQDPDWQCAMLEAIDRIDDDHARLVSSVLRLADATVRRYATEGTSARESSSGSLRATFSAAFRDLGLHELPESFLIMYEDCGAPLTVQLNRTAAEQPAFDALEDLALRLQGTASTRAEMAKMRHFFDTRYGPDRSEVPLLSFFEDYYREHLSEHLKIEADRRKPTPADHSTKYDLFNPYGLDAVKQLSSAGKRWTEAIRAAWAHNPDAVEIVIDPRNCPGLDDVPPLGRNSPRSVAFFCQMFHENAGSGKTRILVANGQTFLGLGKYFSRFLFLTSGEFAKRVKDENSALGVDRIVEIGGDANFNANLHPALLDDVIAYPTGDGDPTAAGVRCDDLVVGRDADDPIALALFDRNSRQRTYAVDLGFLNPGRRPALYRLLMVFAPGRSASIAMPTTYELKQPSQPSQPSPPPPAPLVIYRPRIVYGDGVVLARRLWSVPAPLFPQRLGGETESQMFLRINSWRADLGLPARTYIRISRPRGPASGSPQQTGMLNEEATAPGDIESAGHDGHVIAGDGARDADGDYESEGLDESEAETNVEDPPPQPIDVNGSAPGGMQAKKKQFQRPSRDYSKPQFIDFESPLLVGLFIRMTAGLQAFTALIEEEYPTVAALPAIDGEPHAAEYVVQLHWPVAR